MINEVFVVAQVLNCSAVSAHFAVKKIFSFSCFGHILIVTKTLSGVSTQIKRTLSTSRELAAQAEQLDFEYPDNDCEASALLRVLACCTPRGFYIG